MIRNQFVFDLHEEMIVDNFAGGGGASTGIELALGRCVDIAINHDPEAIAMHRANHPQTRHLVEDVFEVHPLEVCGWRQNPAGQWVGGRRVGFGWFSPDCKHFSKAKGGKPRSKKIRGLAWVVVKWAMAFRKAGIQPPRVMGMENVEEFKTWGPLLTDGKPCSEGSARTFECFRAILTTGVAADHPDLPDVREALGDVWDEELARQGLGYAMETREIRASTTRAPTIRKRLYIILRCDGRPIVWPEPTHGDPKSPAVKAKKRAPWKTAADCIDWNIPCRSIFERNRPLAPATLRRIARGIEKFVLNSPNPFIVKVNHGGDGFRGQSITEPIQTITGKHGYGIAVPHVTKFRAGSLGSGIDEPLHTVTAGGEQARPGTGNAMGLIETHLAPFLTEHANASGQRNFPADEPLRTQCSEVKGGHFAEVTAFLAKHYTEKGSEVQGSDLKDPMATVTSVDHNALVTATIVGCGGRMGQSPPRGMDEPVQTLTSKADSCLVTAQVIRTDMPKSNAGCVFDPEEPLRTVTSGGGFGIMSATLVGAGGPSYSGKPRPVDAPLNAQTTENHAAIAAVNLVRHFGNSVGSDVAEPVGTICAGGAGKTEIAVSHLSKLYGTTTGQDAREPMHTVTGGGNHIAEVRAFLVKYYGNEKEAVSLEDPMHTVTAKDRIGLVTIHGEEYVITDIGMRMLEPHELYAAQGFPQDYIIAPVVPRKRGKKIVHAPLPKHAQVRMCGNSVCPPVAEALVLANVPELNVRKKGARAA